jgi:hypothetical protein
MDEQTGLLTKSLHCWRKRAGRPLDRSIPPRPSSANAASSARTSLFSSEPRRNVSNCLSAVRRSIYNRKLPVQ